MPYLKNLLIKLLGNQPCKELNTLEIALLIITHPLYLIIWHIDSYKQKLKKFINSL